MNERRRFLQVLGGSAVAVGLGCGSSQSGTGAGSGAGAGSSAAGTGGGSSASSSSHAASSSSGQCGTGGASTSGMNKDMCQSNAGTFDVGKPTDYAKAGLYRVTNVASNVLIGRDAGGLWALSSLCTHQCCDLNDPTQSTFATVSGQPVIHCTCHDSLFAYDGSVVGGPAPIPLAAYDLSLGCDGVLYVDTTKVVAASQRLMA